eukprot:6736172-Ditylum_brightwellii.AAC.1
MNAWDAQMIVFLPFSEMETKSKSPRKSGYNVFVSWFFLDFGVLYEEEKERYLISCCVWDVPVFYMSDKDSMRTAPLFKPYHVMNAAAKQWHCLDNIGRQCGRRG